MEDSSFETGCLDGRPLSRLWGVGERGPRHSKVEM
jgi:hypothetical protein